MIRFMFSFLEKKDDVLLFKVIARLRFSLKQPWAESILLLVRASWKKNLILRGRAWFFVYNRGSEVIYGVSGLEKTM
jgi:hypothetical protein